MQTRSCLSCSRSNSCRYHHQHYDADSVYGQHFIQSSWELTCDVEGIGDNSSSVRSIMTVIESSVCECQGVNSQTTAIQHAEPEPMLISNTTIDVDLSETIPLRITWRPLHLSRVWRVTWQYQCITLLDVKPTIRGWIWKQPSTLCRPTADCWIVLSN